MSRSKRSKKRVNAQKNQSSLLFTEQKQEITGVFLIGLAGIAAAATFFNSAGFIGEMIKEALFYLFGKNGAFIPIVFIAFSGGLLIGAHRIHFINRRFMALLLLFLVTLTLIHWSSGVDLETASQWRRAVDGGGIFGHFLTKNLLVLFGDFGTVIVLGVLVIIAFILMLEKSLTFTVKELLKCVFFSRRELHLPSIQQASTEESYTTVEPSITDSKLKNSGKIQSVKTAEPNERHPSKVIATLQNMLQDKRESSTPPKSSGRHPKRGGAAKANFETEPELDFIPKRTENQGPYQLPEINLIEQSRLNKKNFQNVDQAQELEETLSHFGIQAQVIEVHHGPVITRYDLHPAPGVKVSRIVNLADDLALALAAKGLRLEAPIPGKAAIGIEVPNQEAQTVSFRDMLESKNFWNSGKISVALGMDIAGEVVMADLGKMPHLLVAGATGSGKSVCVNTLIMSILFKAFPNEVKFIMIDPKMVELSMYNGIPHLMAPVVTEAKKASGVLKLVVDEMERRYKLFAEARVRDLHKYNEQLSENERLPYIIVIIDELADLMMVAPVEVEDSICRIAQMARATGIHLVIATQRPSVDVITGLIKANVPSRIAFAVSSQIDSRTILDGVGAERLLGRGDMLFSPVGSMKPRRIQGAFVVEKEIEAVIQHWKGQGEPDYQEKFMNIPDKAERVVDEDQDELFWDAVRIVVEYGQASASVLQRRLRVGYTRAARLVDMMEAKGMIGPYEGSKPREVYITAHQMEELKNKTQN